VIAAALAVVPVDPTEEEARRLLTEELKRRVYQEQESLLDRFSRWLGDRMSVPGLSGGGAQWWVIALVLVVAGAVVFFVLRGPLRRSPELAGPAIPPASKPATSRQAREHAEELARTGQWAQATIEAFRAIVLLLAERKLIGPPEGMTAHEVVTAARPRLPDHSRDLATGATTFDALAYGGRLGTAESYEQMSGLLAVVTKTRGTMAAPEPVIALTSGSAGEARSPQ